MVSKIDKKEVSILDLKSWNELQVYIFDRLDIIDDNTLVYKVASQIAFLKKCDIEDCNIEDILAFSKFILEREVKKLEGNGSKFGN